MWIRNLVFVGLVLGGAVALSASLSPPKLARQESRQGAGPAPSRGPSGRRR